MSNTIMLNVTDKAAEKAKNLLLGANDSKHLGLKIGISQGGCSGLTYEIEFADKINKGDEVVKYKGVTFIIDPAATLFLIGSTVDWQEDKFKSGFIFKNPNETSRCGCGESFSI